MRRHALNWYFAYGSNLDRGTFCGRRRMQPCDARRGCLRDFALRFDLAVGSGNRGVANLVSETGNAVWGVVYQISATECKRLDRSEGVHRGFYVRTQVKVELEDVDEIEAFTYTSSRGQTGRLPSARYLGLIVTGAIYHRLPGTWIDQLRAWPMAVDEREARQGKLF